MYFGADVREDLRGADDKDCRVMSQSKSGIQCREWIEEKVLDEMPWSIRFD